MTLVKFFFKLPAYGKTFKSRTIFQSWKEKMPRQQNFLFQREILLLTNFLHRSYTFTFLLPFKKLLFINAAQNLRLMPWSQKEKKWFLKWSWKEQNVTPDIFSYKCRIEIKLSKHNHLNLNDNFWMLYAQVESFTIFMTTLLAKTVMEGIGYGHYIP